MENKCSAVLELKMHIKARVKMELCSLITPTEVQRNWDSNVASEMWIDLSPAVPEALSIAFWLKFYLEMYASDTIINI